MTITVDEIAGVGIVRFSKEVGVEVNIVGANTLEVEVTPNPNAQPDTIYAAKLSIDGVALGNKGLTWTAAEIADVQQKAVIFSGVDLNAVDRILVEVAIDTVLPLLLIASGVTTIGVASPLEFIMSAAVNGLAGYIATATIRDPSIARFVDVGFPPEFPLQSHDPDPVSGPVVEFRGADLNSVVQAGATDILLGSLSVEGLAAGTTIVDINVTQLDDDGGFNIPRLDVAGILTVT